MAVVSVSRIDMKLFKTRLAKRLLLGVLGGIATVLSFPISTQAADPALTLNPKKPVIDVTREISRKPVRRKPAPAKVRKRPKTRLVPEVRPTAQSAQPTSRSKPSLTVDDVLRQDLPPLDDADTSIRTLQPSGEQRRQTRRRAANQTVKPLHDDAWRGVSMKRFEEISRAYARRPRSRAVRALWVRMFASAARPPQGAYNAVSFEALRMQALYRLGALQEIVNHADGVPDGASYAILNILAAKSRIALGDEETACAAAKSLISEEGKVAERLQREFVEISVYCALRSDDRARASLMMELSRDRGLDAPATFGVVDDLTLGRVPRLPKGRRLALIPGKLLILGGYQPKRRFFSVATPALLLALAYDPDVNASIRVTAAERAAELGALSPDGLRSVYIQSGRTPGEGGKRAALMQRIDELARGRRSGGRILAEARRLLDASRRSAIYPVIAAMLGPDIRSIRQTRDAQTYAETAIEIAVASGQHDAAIGWAIFGSAYENAGTGAAGPNLMHWQMPVDISDARRGSPRGAGLVPTERLALRGRFSSDVLHRLVTVLDSLGYIVPIPLWNKASQSPQPAKGYLPKTGVLSDLARASKDRQIGHTLLLAIASLGPDGANKAHLIALGDSLRALRRAGLEDAARDIAFEMVFPVWPRQTRR